MLSELKIDKCEVNVAMAGSVFKSAETEKEVEKEHTERNDKIRKKIIKQEQEKNVFYTLNERDVSKIVKQEAPPVVSATDFRSRTS